MARAAWVVVGIGALVVSYVACQNTWQGLKQDARENAALAKQKTKDVRLDDAARTVRDEAREAARRAGEGLKKVAGNLRPQDETAPATEATPTASAPSSTSREVNEAIGKVAAKTRETGEDAAHHLQGAAVHLEVQKALAGETGLDASRIDVDIEDAARTVVLRGSVADAAQKAAAGRIAAARAPGYQVRNELATIAATRP